MFLRANDKSYSTGLGGSIGMSRDGLYLAWPFQWTIWQGLASGEQPAP